MRSLLLSGLASLAAGGSSAYEMVAGGIQVGFEELGLLARQTTGQLLQSNLQVGGIWLISIPGDLKADISLHHDVKTFTGALGGASAPAITSSGDSTRPYEVDGNTFTDFQSAAQRSCDDQMNSCAQIANAGGSTSTFTVADCNDQDAQCKATASSATVTTFATLTSQNAEFDFFCE